MLVGVVCGFVISQQAFEEAIVFFCTSLPFVELPGISSHIPKGLPVSQTGGAVQQTLLGGVERFNHAAWNVGLLSNLEELSHSGDGFAEEPNCDAAFDKFDELRIYLDRLLPAPYRLVIPNLWRINLTIDSLGSLSEEQSGGMKNVETSSRDSISVRWTSLTRALSLGFSSRQEFHVVGPYALNASFVLYVMGRARSSLAMWSATD